MDVAIKIALANAIAESLWMKGLISDIELKKIKDKMSAVVILNS